MRIRNFICLAVFAGICMGVMCSAARSADPASPKLRYGFQANREYPYHIKIHSELFGNQVDQQGELIYTAISADDEKVVLKTSGSALSQLGDFGAMNIAAMRRPALKQRDQKGTTVNRRGQVLGRGESNQLPQLFGGLETVLFDEFPEEAKERWENTRDISDLLAGGAGAPRGGPRNEVVEAKEIVDLSIIEVRDDIVRIHKKYELITSPIENVSKFKFTGSGEIEFDLKKGVPRKTTMNYKIIVERSEINLTIPLTMTLRLMTDSEWAALKKKQERDTPASTYPDVEAKEPPQLAAKKASAPPAAADASEMRTWSDASGKFKLEASLVSVKGEMVTLKQKDGRLFQVSLKKLCKEDQEFIQTEKENAFSNVETD
jgi:hypothetical protein